MVQVHFNEGHKSYVVRPIRPVARIFRRGYMVSDFYVCIYKHAQLKGLGACFPKKVLEIRDCF